MSHIDKHKGNNMGVNMAAYIVPEKVISPQKHWSLIKVLHDGGPGNYSVALGRWNGSGDSPIGNPQSRGLPTWFIVPGNYQESIVEQLSKDMVSFVKTFFK